ncbi:hypothetical protein ACN6LF_004661 [[Kitasatospora] papulosa]|nr:hypothetical protein [Streptomyces sp. SL203]MCY1649282.1 hypothetical protein [Streptomyces sp. SL203]
MANRSTEPLTPDRAPSSTRRRPGPPPVIDFPPVHNGIDYLRSVVTHLRPKSGGKPRDIKYAVLHLQAAAEVLLKTRLARVHWSLVFKDPGKATRAKHADADFDSCGTVETVKRLRNIADIAISTEEESALVELAKLRNKLQHYGLTSTAEAVEARAATVLDFLVRFIDEELAPELAKSGALQLEMEVVRRGLKDVQSFVTKRMDRLRGNELKEAADRTLRCPDCQQLAALAEAGWCRCHFCGRGWPSNELAYVLQTAEVQDTQLAECPGCHAPTLTDEAEFADGKNTLFCTSCARRYSPAELGTCTACGCYWSIGDVEPGRQLICTDCDDRIRREEDERYWM